MNFVVVGNGVAGNSAASVIRKQNKKVKITLVTEEDSPAYSACALGNYIANEINEKYLYIRSLNEYKNQNIHIMFNQKVNSIDLKSNILFANHRKIPFDKLILATGSLPLILPIPGHKLRGVFTLKTINNAKKIINHNPNKVVIVGSGPIGIEAAVSLKKKNCEVVLIEVQNRILPNLFDEKPSEIIKKILENNGIKVFTREKVLEFRGKEKVSMVVTDKRKIKCDTVIMAVGMKPNTQLAKDCSLKLSSTGSILVNRKMETSNHDVYACGDCVETSNLFTGTINSSMLWHNAKQQGDIAGYNLLGFTKNYKGHFSIVGINLFRNHAVAIEKPGDFFQKENIRIIEKSSTSGYYRIIIKSDFIRGAQYIGHFDDFGLLFTLMKSANEMNIGFSVLKENHTKTKNIFAHRIFKYFSELK